MRIDKLISEQLQPEQLFRLGALTCVTAFPQEAGSDILYDAVFAYASRRCAILLSKRADSSSADLLARLQPLCGRDGGEKLMYDELIERQKKLAPHAP